ncbi:SDR family NAD(P)-dependent oxidoreductase [Carboxydochorda subterranea]|uniref:SDR family NAD(P)-dependent oxidoreductase n=1 Tax=Carboxydichorda subterranea TaxID=3109565 RepID=A0ABZ1C1L8_9FIRM|nr:SDR family NAD(P)-dependent oxidoreductase [Limnochorda sp. L945t]WRP18824.1 SDR family NAD(P)-dependent oxidoreductase [Limnochorda sp. L945t]
MARHRGRRRVLVTGGAGFIGSHLVDRLVERGDEVAVVDNFDPFYEPAVKRANIERHVASGAIVLFEADIRNRAAMEQIFWEVRPEIVLHLAAKAGVRPSLEDPRGYADVNVMGTVNLLELAREHGVGRFVFGSSSSVYGGNEKVPFAEDDPILRPASPYGATKAAGEALCESFAAAYGLPVVALRFFTVYGPRQRPDLAIHKFARLMLAGRPIPVYGDGTTERDYTYIDDIITGIERAMQWEGLTQYRDANGNQVPYRVFNLGSDRPVRLGALITLLARTLGCEPVVEYLPEQPGDMRRTWADLSRSRTELGYSPSVPIEEGLHRFADWLRAEDGS